MAGRLSSYRIQSEQPYQITITISCSLFSLIECVCVCVCVCVLTLYVQPFMFAWRDCQSWRTHYSKQRRRGVAVNSPKNSFMKNLEALGIFAIQHSLELHGRSAAG